MPSPSRRTARSWSPIRWTRAYTSALPPPCAKQRCEPKRARQIREPVSDQQQQDEGDQRSHRQRRREREVVRERVAAAASVAQLSQGELSAKAAGTGSDHRMPSNDSTIG